MSRRSCTRQMVERAILPPLLGLMVGCSPTGDSSGCEEAPQATDARFTGVRLESQSVPCYSGPQVPQGSDPHLVVTFDCPGKSLRFLVAISVDGKIQSMKEAEGAGYGNEVRVDTGPWEAADTTWHQVQVVLDPLNLFQERDESNNRGGAEVRVVAPDAVLDGSNCGFVVPRDAGGDGYTRITQVPAGTPVEVWLFMTYGGPYDAIIRSVRSVTTLDASDTLAVVTCHEVYNRTFVTRWTPPGAGIYDVEFKIDPLGTVPDLATNNVATKQLTVTSAPPASLRPARGEDRP